LAADVGTLLTAKEFDELIGKWRNPRRRKADKAALTRRQLAGELALRRDRLRRLGAIAEPKLAAEIEMLQQQLVRTLQPQV